MTVLFVCIAFVFGLLFGSFANVVVLRWGTGRGIGGRSTCGSCGHVLSWFELIPVVSYIALRGRCRNCGSKISPQYALAEFTFGVLFAMSAYVACTSYTIPFAYIFFLFACVFVFLLVCIAVYDILHFIIPDGLVYAFIALSCVWGVYNGGASLTALEMVCVAGFLTALPLFLLWAMSRGRWMGFGDIKLAVGMGMMLGILGGISALVFGIWLGAIVSLLILGFKHLRALIIPSTPSLEARGRRFTMKSEIPFGPFLIAGTFIVFLLRITMITFLGRF